MIVTFLKLLHTDPERHPIGVFTLSTTHKGMTGRYFRSVETAVPYVEKVDTNPATKAVYTNLQQLKPGATDRRGEDVESYTHLILDCDRKTSSTANATDSELRVVVDYRDTIVETLAKEGWPIPAKTMSGNGAGAIYKLELAPADAEHKAMMEAALKALSARFDFPVNAHIDTSMFDPPRITKVAGTMVRKFPETEGCPHRRAQLISADEGALSWEQLRRFVPVGRPPVVERKARPLHKDFSLVDFLDFYGFKHSKKADTIGDIFNLDRCPISGAPHATHTSTSTAFILLKDGGLGFQCQSDGHRELKAADAVKALASRRGDYPKPIWEKSFSPEVSSLVMPIAGLTRRQAQRWIWNPVLAEAGMLNLSGMSSQGKSPLVIDLCARMSKLPGHEGYGRWPDGQMMKKFPLHSILLNSEDDLSSSILPCFDEAGGCDMFFHPITGVQVSKDDKIRQRMLALKEDIGLICDEARKLAPHLGVVVLDPVTNYLGRLRMNQEEEVREALMPLVQLQQELRFNVITVSHLNKGEGDPMSRVMGARAFIGVARTAWQCSDDPDPAHDHYHHIMSPIRGKMGHGSFKFVDRGRSFDEASRSMESVEGPRGVSESRRVERRRTIVFPLGHPGEGTSLPRSL
jgi:hypothetical protein